MLNPTGGLDVCCTMAENENSVWKPWLWIAQKQASKAISKKSQELSWFKRPASIHVVPQTLIIGQNNPVKLIKTCGHIHWEDNNSNRIKGNHRIPSCDRISILKEPFCRKALEIKSIRRRYKSAKWASHRRIKDSRIFLLTLWLKRYIRKNITET